MYPTGQLWHPLSAGEYAGEHSAWRAVNIQKPPPLVVVVVDFIEFVGRVSSLWSLTGNVAGKAVSFGPIMSDINEEKYHRLLSQYRITLWSRYYVRYVVIGVSATNLFPRERLPPPRDCTSNLAVVRAYENQPTCPSAFPEFFQVERVSRKIEKKRTFLRRFHVRRDKQNVSAL